MKTAVRMILLIGGFLLLFGMGAYRYGWHAPLPEPPPLTGTVVRGAVVVDTLRRTYTAYVPAEAPRHPALVLVFHGSRGSGEQMRVFTGYEFERLADRHGFLVVYPDGYERHWNDCRAGGPYTANTLDIDDPGFVRVLIRQLRQDQGVDPAQVFATGFSNGGHMAYRLALEWPQTVRAVAAIGANLPTWDNLDCAPRHRPVAVLVLNGTADPINPFDGGPVSIYGLGKRGTVQSAEASVRYFSRLAGYAPEQAVRTSRAVAAAAAPVDIVAWQGAARPEVRLMAVRGGGHTIPQPRFRFPRLLGPTHTDVNAPAAIWAFFARQRPVQGVETGLASPP